MTKRSIYFVAGLFLILILGYGFGIEPRQVRVEHINIRIPGAELLLKGKTAMLISDLHMDGIGILEKRILKLVSENPPDFIFLTGDFIRWKGDPETAFTFFSRLKAKIGIWGVLGEYDYSDSRKSCRFCHAPGSYDISYPSGIPFLKNEERKVSLEGGTIRIFGLDPNVGEPKHILAKAINFKDGPVIILSHFPYVFDLVDDRTNALLLAGDTHGGQIPLPSFLWRKLGYIDNADYEKGLFQKQNKTMYVTRGIGTSHLPFRLFNPPELTVIHF